MLNSSSKTAPELAKALERNGFYSSDQYYVGHTKIFLKFETGLLLEQARNHQVGACSIKFQRIIRGWLARRRLYKKKTTLKLLKVAIESKNIDTLQNSVNSGIENMLEHTPLFRQANTILDRLKQEKQVTDFLSNTLLSLNLTYLRNAVQKAKSLNPPFDNPLVEKCQEKILELEASPENASQHTQCFPISPDAPFPPPPPPRKDNDNSHSLDKNSESINNTSNSREEENKIPPPPLEDPEIFLVPPPPRSSSHTNNDSKEETEPFDERISELTNDDDNGDDDDDDGDIFDSERPRPIKKGEFKRQESRSLSPVSRINRVEVRPLSSYMHRSKSPPPTLESSNFTEKLPETGLPADRKVRRTVINRRVSQEEFDEMKSLHEAITVLVEASNTEDGLSESHIAPLEEILTTIQSSGNHISNEASHLMLANEELIRAKQQLELQRKLSELGENAPRWKVRNRLQQASKLGMSNFAGRIITFFFFLL